MKARDWGILALGGVLGLIGCAILQTCVSSGPERAPTLGGQEVPNENFVIDFSRRYRIILSDAKGSPAYENAKILGYTGETVRESSGRLSKGYGHFGRWLVIELPDRRRVYLSPGHISYIEDMEPIPEK